MDDFDSYDLMPEGDWWTTNVDAGEVAPDYVQPDTSLDFGGGFDLGALNKLLVALGGADMELDGRTIYPRYGMGDSTTAEPTEEQPQASEAPMGQTLKPAGYNIEDIRRSLDAYGRSNFSGQPTGTVKTAPTLDDITSHFDQGNYAKALEALLGSNIGKALFAGGLGWASFIDAKNQNPMDLTKGTRAAFQEQLQKPKQFQTAYYPSDLGGPLARTSRPLA